MINMGYQQGSGLMLLKQQRAERNKRLAGLTQAEYFRAMEDIRDGKEPSRSIKKYMLASYN